LAQEHVEDLPKIWRTLKKLSPESGG